MSDLFITAARKKFRFASVRGDLTTENLWDLELKHRSGCDLDAVAKAVNAELKAETEESFVETKANVRKTDLEAKLEIVKFVIAAKIAEGKASAERVERAEKRRKLLDALEAKKDQQLTSASIDQLEKQLAELDA